MKHSLLETTIGAIVLLAAIFFLGFSYSTANQGTGVMDGAYRLQAMFDNVGGLKAGDGVMIGGVKIGTIDDIALDPKTYRARVTFHVNDDVKLARDSSARISSESLLGGKYLEVQPGGDDVDLKSGDNIGLTQSATNLEDLLGRFIFSAADAAKDKGSAGGAPDMPAASDSP